MVAGLRRVRVRAAAGTRHRRAAVRLARRRAPRHHDRARDRLLRHAGAGLVPRRARRAARDRYGIADPRAAAGDRWRRAVARRAGNSRCDAGDRASAGAASAAKTDAAGAAASVRRKIDRRAAARQYQRRSVQRIFFRRPVRGTDLGAGQDSGPENDRPQFVVPFQELQRRQPHDRRTPRRDEPARRQRAQSTAAACASPSI